MLPAAACGGDEEGGADEEPKVAVSIFPLYDVARRIAGERLEVVCVLPPGRGGHSYDPSPREVARLTGTDLAVSVGLELDDWLHRIVQSAAGEDVARLELGPQLEPRRMTQVEVGDLEGAARSQEAPGDDAGHEAGEHEEGEHHEEEAHGDEDHEDHEEHAEEAHGDEGGEHAEAEEQHEHEHEDEHEDEHEESERHGEAHHHHGAEDPHFWLDPVRMVEAVDLLVAAFAGLDPAGADAFRERGAALKRELEALHEEVLAASRAWTKRTIVTFHGSFGYFAERYDLRIAAVVEPFPGREPTPRYVADVLAALRGADVAALFYEPQLDPRPARVISEQAHTPLFELDPMGGTEGRESYEALLRHDVSVLNDALR